MLRNSVDFLYNTLLKFPEDASIYGFLFHNGGDGLLVGRKMADNSVSYDNVGMLKKFIEERREKRGFQLVYKIFDIYSNEWFLKNLVLVEDKVVAKFSPIPARSAQADLTTDQVDITKLLIQDFAMPTHMVMGVGSYLNRVDNQVFFEMGDEEEDYVPVRILLDHHSKECVEFILENSSTGERKKIVGLEKRQVLGNDPFYFPILQTFPRKKRRLVMRDLLDLEYGYPDSVRIYDVKDIQHVIDGPTFFISGGRTDFVTVAEVRDVYNRYTDIHFTTELSLLADGVYHSVERIQLLGTDMRQKEYTLVFSDSK